MCIPQKKLFPGPRSECYAIRYLAVLRNVPEGSMIAATFAEESGFLDYLVDPVSQYVPAFFWSLHPYNLCLQPMDELEKHLCRMIRGK
jgi:hypothetical protein